MFSPTHLNLIKTSIANEGALHTSKEISYQPHLWMEVVDLISSQKDEIKRFLDPILALENIRIILTGAGSSAFIGESAQGIVQVNTGKVTQAIATTDLVTNPELYLINEVPTLMISFARSGNSPESIEALRLGNQYVDQIFHLIITCNNQGELSAYSNKNSSGSLCINLPDAANDRSLAMTGSFTSMLLSALLISNLDEFDSSSREVLNASEAAEILLNNCLDDFIKISSGKFERVVFLGSGPLLGIARECHLKLQELTDGKVICKHDSFLGFRHGPRVVLNDKCLVVYLFSNDLHVYKYERDLVLSIAKDPRKIPNISFGAQDGDHFNSVLSFSEVEPLKLAGNFRILVGTMIGQLIGFYKSLDCGLNPDNPSVSGAISRVVQGVKIYNKI